MRAITWNRALVVGVLAIVLTVPAAASAETTASAGTSDDAAAAAVNCTAVAGVTRSLNGRNAVFSGFVRCGQGNGIHVEILAYKGNSQVQHFVKKSAKNCFGTKTCHGTVLYVANPSGNQTFCSYVWGRYRAGSIHEDKACRVM